MSVPPLRLSNNFNSYISGEVIIHPSAVLAPGVILQAAVNSKIIIGSGVCIGMGSILQANEGTLEVEAGANLGAGFLMVGKGQIGTNACIGSATTVFNCSVAPGQVVPPGSVLGDTSRRIEEAKQPQSSTTNHTSASEQNGLGKGESKVISSTNLSAGFMELKHQSVSQSAATPESQSSAVENLENSTSSSSGESNQASTEIGANDLDPSQPATESPNGFGTQIYGQGSIRRLLTTLFPHRQSLSDPNSDNQSE